MRRVYIDQNGYLRRFSKERRSGWQTNVDLEHIPCGFKVCQVTKDGVDVCNICFWYLDGIREIGNLSGSKIYTSYDGRIVMFDCSFENLFDDLIGVRTRLYEESRSCNTNEMRLHYNIIAVMLSDYMFDFLVPAQ